MEYLNLRNDAPEANRKRMERRAKIISLYASGLTYKKIGEQMGLSRQRIQQIVRPPIQVLNALRKRANDCCERCGIPLRLGTGHTHHAEKDITGHFSDLQKLRYLCPSCHRTEDYALSRATSCSTHILQK